MQVSKFFIGVNIAATLSVALTGQAKAEKKFASADFLKASLGAVKKDTPQELVAKTGKLSSVAPNPQSTQRFSAAKSVAVRNELKDKKVKLMEFVPNRKLPSRRELALKEQKAQMAQLEPSQPMSASISSYSPFYLSTEMQSNLKSAKAQRAARRQVRRTASKVVKKAAEVATQFVSGQNHAAIANQVPVLPGQVGHPCSSNHSIDYKNYTSMASRQNQQSIQPTSQHQSIMQSAVQNSSMPINSSNNQVANEVQRLEAPNLSNEERAQLDRLARVLFLKDKLHNSAPSVSSAGGNGFHSPLDSNTSSRQRVENAYSRVGPPPFPLNLVPEPAMKDFLSKARNRKSMISSYPGAFASRPSNMQGAGFQSYAKSMKTAGFTSYSKHATNFSHGYASGHASTNFHSNISHGKSNNAYIAKHKIASRHHVSVSHTTPVVHQAHAQVATYGPYGSTGVHYQGL